MEHKEFWMALDYAREKAVDGAQQLGKAAEEAAKAVRTNLENITPKDSYQKYCAGAEYLRGKLNGFQPEVLMILG